MSYLIPKTSKTKLKLFKFLSLFDVLILSVGLIIGGFFFWLLKVNWQKWLLLLFSIAISGILIVPFSVKEKDLKLWEWIWLLIKFHFRKQLYWIKRKEAK